jgi:hypothetical protein
LHVSDLSSASLNFTYEACHDCIFILAIWHDRTSDSVIYGSGPTFIPARPGPQSGPTFIPARSNLIRRGLAIRSDYYTCLLTMEASDVHSYITPDMHPNRTYTDQLLEQIMGLLDSK